MMIRFLGGAAFGKWYVVFLVVLGVLPRLSYRFKVTVVLTRFCTNTLRPEHARFLTKEDSYVGFICFFQLYDII